METGTGRKSCGVAWICIAAYIGQPHQRRRGVCRRRLGVGRSSLSQMDRIVWRGFWLWIVGNTCTHKSAPLASIRLKGASAHRQGTFAVLPLYKHMAFSFPGCPPGKNLEDGVMYFEAARHIGHFLVTPESTTSPDFPLGSRHCRMHCFRR